METRLSQSQTQKLVLSPQIRQYLRLLQLPLAQLVNAVEQELAENPVLEEVTKEPSEETSPSPAPEESPTMERTTEELRFDKTLSQLNETFAEGYQDQDLSVPETAELQKRKDFQESLIRQKESLTDFLLWQMGLLDFNEWDRKIADEIIGNLSEEGFLRIPLEDIARSSEATVEEVEKVLKNIQELDPPGIAARNLQETLLIQLEKRGPEATLARQIVQSYFPLLEKKQWDPIAKRLGVNPEEIQQAGRLIAHLDPKPGRTFYGEETVAVRPDASVFYDESEENKLTLEVHEDGLPEIRINPYYRKLIREASLDESGRRFLKERIQAGLDFLRALSQRQSTLQNITQEIVNAQPQFFETGFSGLKPLRLKDISASLRIHESTVSRAIQGKYLSTPYGTLPYKSFFSNKMEGALGSEESQKSLMEKVRELIRSENPAHPLSDQEITQILQKEGIRIARRTVAKYRELLRILPSHLRRKN